MPADTKVFCLQVSFHKHLSFEESRLTHLENLSILYVMNSNISKYLIYFFLDLWPDMSFPGCCRNFLFSWRNPRSIRGSGVDSKEICWRMWKRWGTEPVADHVKRGGWKGKRKGHSPPLPLPFPFLRKSVQGRECIVRMLSTLVYICFVQGRGAGFVWYLNTIERSDRTLFFKSKDLSVAILLTIGLVFLPGYFRVAQYSSTIAKQAF